MEYRVKINPYKEKEFLQLLSAWESLGVVSHYEVIVSDDHREASQSMPEGTPRKHRKVVDTAWEIAEPYKDLLD